MEKMQYLLMDLKYFVNFDNYDIEKYISNKYKIEKVNVQENILNIRTILCID